MGMFDYFKSKEQPKRTADSGTLIHAPKAKSFLLPKQSKHHSVYSKASPLPQKERSQRSQEALILEPGQQAMAAAADQVPDSQQALVAPVPSPKATSRHSHRTAKTQTVAQTAPATGETTKYRERYFIIKEIR